MLADISPGTDRIFLKLAVDDLAHAADQKSVLVFGQQRIPSGAPNDFDHVPACPAEGPFQLLDDLAVAADRAVEALKIAVDDEDQVIELFAGGQGNGAQGFGLVALAVAQEGPNAGGFGVGLYTAIDQIMIESRLIDGHDRAQAHRDGGKFPEIGHQPGMRIGRQAWGGLQLAAEIFQLIFAQPAQQKRPGVNSRRGVPLEIDLIGRERAFLAADKVVERHFI